MLWVLDGDNLRCDYRPWFMNWISLTSIDWKTLSISASWNDLEDQVFHPPPSFFAAGEREYEVDRILDRRGRGSTLEYLVKWKGHSSDDNTWEPAAHLKCKELQPMVHAFNEDFHRRKCSRS